MAMHPDEILRTEREKAAKEENEKRDKLYADLTREESLAKGQEIKQRINARARSNEVLVQRQIAVPESQKKSLLEKYGAPLSSRYGTITERKKHRESGSQSGTRTSDQKDAFRERMYKKALEGNSSFVRANIDRQKKEIATDALTTSNEERIYDHEMKMLRTEVDELGAAFEQKYAQLQESITQYETNDLSAIERARRSTELLEMAREVEDLKAKYDEAYELYDSEYRIAEAEPWEKVNDYVGTLQDVQDLIQLSAAANQKAFRETGNKTYADTAKRQLENSGAYGDEAMKIMTSDNPLQVMIEQHWAEENKKVMEKPEQISGRLSQLETETAQLEEQLRQAQNRMYSRLPGTTLPTAQEINDLQSKINRNKETITALGRQQIAAEKDRTALRYASIADAEDFEKFSKATESKLALPASTKGDAAASEAAIWGTVDQGDAVYDYINDIDDYRELMAVRGEATGEGDPYAAYGQMTKEEIGIYNYLYATEGRESAEDYLAYLQDALNKRLGEKWAEKMNGLGKAVYWLPAGLQQWASGTAQLFSEEALPTSPITYASGEIQTDAHQKSKVLGILYDLGTTAANMAPSILLSSLVGGGLVELGVSANVAGKIAGGLGSATLGASAGGGAYTQKVKEGYTKDEAKTYAALVGVSEALLQYALNGVAALGSGGGGIAGVLGKKISAIDSALGRIALRSGGNILGNAVNEASEEALQALLEPLFQSLVFDEPYSVNFEEVAYSALLGALSGGLLEGTGALNAAIEKDNADLFQQTLQEAIERQWSGETEAPEVPERVVMPEEVEAPVEAEPVQEAGFADVVQATMNETYEDGGKENGWTETAQSGADSNTPDGGERWNSGTGTGGQSGVLGIGADAEKVAEQGRTARARRDQIQTTQRVTLPAYTFGADGKDVQLNVIRETDYDDDLQNTAEWIRETGHSVQFFLGPIRLNGRRYRAVNLHDGRILIQADDSFRTVEQLAKHELFHTAQRKDPELRAAVREKIVNQFSEEDLNGVIQSYMEHARGLTDLAENATEEEIAAYTDAILEEILCDAYAGINAFGVDVEQFAPVTIETARERGASVDYDGQNAQAMDRTTGPPNFSISETIEDDLRAVFNRTYDSDNGEVYIGETSNFLTTVIGAEPLVVTMPENKAYSAMVSAEKAKADNRYDPNVNYHNLGKMGLIRALQESENPVAAFAATGDETGKRENRIVLVTDDIDGFGNLVVVESIDEKARLNKKKIHAHKVITAYDREQIASDIIQAGNDGRLLHLDKKRSQTILAGRPGSNSLAAIREADFENNIQNFWANVKWAKSGNSVYTAEGEASGKTEFARAFEEAQRKKENTELQKPSFSSSEDADTEQDKPKKRRKPVAESKPIIAKNDFKKGMLNLFSVESGSRNELGAIVDRYADRILAAGRLEEQDRQQLFDTLYDAGVMTVPGDSYYGAIRAAVNKRKIYIDDALIAELGDDWGALRKKAFANGIYLTRNNVDAGVDVWNKDLSAMFPGSFSEEDTDRKEILERLIDLAEEGRDEKMSLEDMAATIRKQYGPEAVDAHLDNMERQMDWMLRTFAEKAQLEINLRDRTGIKIAQERERSREQMKRVQERADARTERAVQTQREKNQEQLRRQNDRFVTQKAQERARRKEQLEAQRERRELRELQQRTLKQLQWLSKNRNKAPAELQTAFDEVLSDIDVYAVSAVNMIHGGPYSKKHDASWQDLAQLYKDAKANDPNFMPSKELERIVARLDNRKIGEMDYAAIMDLYHAAVGLRTEVYNARNVIADESHRLFADVYADSKEEIQKAASGYKGKALDKFLNWEQLSPMNLIERMAGWNPKSVFYSMGQQLENGEKSVRDYEVRAKRLLNDFLESNKDWVKKADGRGKDAIWYEVEVPELLELHMGDKPIFGKTVKVYMTPAQKVHLYLESKGYDNLNHMVGGRTFADKELYSKGKIQEAYAQGTTVKLAPETVKKLVSDLTPQEMELAEILGSQYYNGFAKERINRVSNILYGYDKATASWYAPIYTNQNYTRSEPGRYDATAEGVGNMKERVRQSSNPSYNLSAFDAFERHISQSAKFTGMAIPVENWNRLMNWQENGDSMADVITHKWGKEAKTYLENLVTDLQNPDIREKTQIERAADTVLSHYISSVFGFNASIVAKQLGSVPMGAPYLGFKNIPTPGQIHKTDLDLVNTYTSDLAYRTLGYATPETKFLKENPNWTQTNKAFNFAFGGGAITAMDGWAAKTLWPWAENKVRREHPELEIGTQAQVDAGQSPYYLEVAKEFETAVARTQSTTDQMHQGTIRKSDSPITKTFTMFRSDSAQSYNMLRQKIGEAQYLKKSGADAAEVKAANKSAGAVLISMLAGQTWAAGVTFIVNMIKRGGDQYKDDEDELTAESIAKTMIWDVVNGMIGTVAVAEEAAELIGNIITGDRWYGIEMPGGEQLENLITDVSDALKGVIEIVGGAVNIAKNEEDLRIYFKRHGRNLLGSIKDAATIAAGYIGRFPADNLEAYLLGLMRWISPDIAAAYDDLFQTITKTKLKGLKGDELEAKIGDLLDIRLGGYAEETTAELARLYEAGETGVLFADTPSSIEIDGEKMELEAYQRQIYDETFRSIAGGRLDEVIASAEYQAASDEDKVKMISGLYDYAAQNAKASVSDYEVEEWALKADEVLSTGLSTGKYLRLKVDGCVDKYLDLYDEGIDSDSAFDLARIFDELTPEDGKDQVSEMQKYRAIADSDMSKDEQVKAIGAIMGTDMTTDSGGKTQYAKMLEILDDGFSVDEYLDLKENKLVDKYLGYEGEDWDTDLAMDVFDELDDLEPEEGKTSVGDFQKWLEVVSMPLSNDDMDFALELLMDDKQLQKYKEARGLGISPYVYCTFKYEASKLSADKNAKGNPIQNSKKKKVINLIQSLGVNNYQQYAYLLSTVGMKP